jgi:hypothetical protein
MAKKKIEAVLWREYATSTSDCLWGERNNQYYIELREGDYEKFFGNKAQRSTDAEGNEAFVITLAPFDGMPPVEKTEITFTRLRDGLARAGKWRINAQHLDQAYPLWQRDRGPLEKFMVMDAEDKRRTFLLITRDVDQCFHARWIRSEDFEKLPSRIKELLRDKSAGWSEL